MAQALGLSSFFNDLQKYKAEYQGRIVVIKFGGALAENDDIIRGIGQQAAFLSDLGTKVVVVHGGGKQIDNALSDQGIEIRKDNNGLRITDEATLKVSDAALRNLNGHIVRLFQDVSTNVKVVGMAGYDGAVVQGEPIGDNYTGQPTKLNDAWLRHVLNGTGDARVIPVIYPICRREQSTGAESRLNINADDVASFIATELEARRLILASDIPGVLDKDKALIPAMSTSTVDRFVADGTVTGGMIPKLRAAAEAANSMRDGGVVILDGRESETILAELLGKGGGTLIQRPGPKSRAPR